MSPPTSGSFEVSLSTPELIALLCALLEHLNSRSDKRDTYSELVEQLILKLQDALDDEELAALARQSGGGDKSRRAGPKRDRKLTRAKQGVAAPRARESP